MEIVEEDGFWIVKDWVMTPAGWLYAGIEWFDSYQEAFLYMRSLSVVEN
jgi:hypothetical protein